MKPNLQLVALLAVILSYSCANNSRSMPMEKKLLGDIEVLSSNKAQRLERRERVAGGQCIAVLTYSGTDDTKFTVDIDMNNSNSNCVVADADPNKNLKVNGTPLLHNPESITFGTGTTTCYGPPIPSPPRCVCTALPCP